MTESRTFSPEHWDDLPWSELGLPAAEQKPKITLELVSDTQNDETKTGDNPIPDKSWDGSGWS